MFLDVWFWFRVVFLGGVFIYGVFLVESKSVFFVCFWFIWFCEIKGFFSFFELVWYFVGFRNGVMELYFV